MVKLYVGLLYRKGADLLVAAYFQAFRGVKDIIGRYRLTIGHIICPGGLLYRKGADLLVAAYFQAFRGVTDVLLVVHSVYGDPTVQAIVRQAVSDQ